MRTAPTKTTLQLLSLVTGVALAALAPSLGLAQDAAPPTPDKGDTAWMLTSTALVLFMAVPGLALFYGGLVRSKNMLSVLMQVFVTFCLISILWFVYGYSLAFTTGNDIFFGEGASPSDRGLLAHELTHVAQQRGMTGGGPLTVGPADDAYEAEAEARAAAVSSGATPPAQREPLEEPEG